MDRPPTHWKQTALYLKDNFIMRKGEKINGTFQLMPYDERLLKISGDLSIDGHYQTTHVKFDFIVL